MKPTKSAATAAPLHDLLAHRWSPRAFDASAKLSDTELLSALEAARWQASAMNEQPWRFLVARRGEPLFDVFAATLMGFNQAWAPNASALILALHLNQDVNGKPLRSAGYELGLAVANLVTQFTADGWHCHQMAGFDRTKLAESVEIAEGLSVVTMIAVGKQADIEILPDELAARESADRHRLELSDIVLRGLPE